MATNQFERPFGLMEQIRFDSGSFFFSSKINNRLIHFVLNVFDVSNINEGTNNNQSQQCIARSMLITYEKLLR
jgi:hypothetical protein